MAKIANPRQYLNIDDSLKGNGIITLVPSNGTVRTAYSPQGQLRCAVQWILEDMVKEYGIKTIIWDGLTTQAYQLVNEYAMEKVNKDDNSKHYTIMLEDGTQLGNTPGINWRDNGMAQKEMYHQLRDKLTSRHDLNWIITGHTVGKVEDDAFGIDAGGPASCRKFTAPLSSSLYIFKSQKDGKRYIITEATKHPKLGLQVQAKWKTTPGVKIEGASEAPGRHMEVPEDDYEGCVAVWKALIKANSAGNEHVVLMGDEDAGKTAFASAYLGVEGRLPALIVMAEAQNSLAAFWHQVLTNKVGAK